MMKKNKILLFILFLVICSPIYSKTIKIWDYPRWRRSPAETDKFYWMKEKIIEFEKKYPDVKMKFTPISWDRGRDKIILSLMSGSAPDIFPGTLTDGIFYSGKLLNVEDYISRKDLNRYMPTALNAFKKNKKIYGIPWYISGNLFFVRTDLLRKYGIDISDKQISFNELEKIFKELERKKKLTGDKKIYGLGLLIAKGNMSSWPILFPKIDVNNGNINLSSTLEKNIVHLMKLIEWKKKGYMHPETGGFTPKTLWEAFSKKDELIAAPFGMWAVSALMKRNIPFDIINYPIYKENKSYTIAGISGFMMSEKSDKEKNRYMTEFIKYITSDENLKALENYGVIPASAKLPKGMYNGSEVYKKILDIFQNSITIDETEVFKKEENLLINYLQKIFIDKNISDINVIKDRFKDIESDTTKKQRKLNIGIVINFIVIFILLICGIWIWITKGVSRKYLIMILPALTVLSIFFVIPQIGSLFLSFFRVKISGGKFLFNYLGLNNFNNLIKEESFRYAIKNTLFYTAVIVPVQTVFALSAASIISKLKKRSALYFKISFYLPYITSIVVISLIWGWIFDFNYGFLNSIIEFFNGERIQWLSSPNYAFKSVIIMSLFITPGASILIFLSYLSNIPEELYEMAKIEGATEYNMWKSITLPLLKPITKFIVIMGIISSFQVFVPVYILTNGGPKKSSTVIVYEIYEKAFEQLSIGAASAAALLLIIAMIIILPIINRLFKVDWV